ncbi:MAG: hydrogenase maturation protease [Candidatus Aminicenantes bacterium]|nr:hydrogenase maturation protease [Candidatus Aminicenantes bacterium]
MTDRPNDPLRDFEAGGAAARLTELLAEPTCLVGVGHILRRDDGFGPWVAGAVRAGLSGTKVRVIDAEDVPENFAPVIARADCRNVVFIDAVAAEGLPGSIVFGPLADFGEAESYSTHRLALSLSGKFLEAAGKKVFLLGVVPADLGFGAGLTAAVARTAASLRDLILRSALPPPD